MRQFTELELKYIDLKTNHPSIFASEHKNIFTLGEISNFMDDDNLQEYILNIKIQRDRKVKESELMKEDIFAHLLAQSLVKMQEIMDLHTNQDTASAILATCKVIAGKNIAYLVSRSKAAGEVDGGAPGTSDNNPLHISYARLKSH